MKKHLPTIFLLGAPGVFMLITFLSCALGRGLTAIAFQTILITFGVIVVFVFVPNIIYALRLLAKGEESNELFFLCFILKVCHIPFYIIMFIIGISLTFLIIFTLPLIIVIIVIDYALLLATSAYGIVGVIRAKKEKKLSLFIAVLHICLHLCFVWDIISAIVLFIKSKKDNRLLA